MKTYTITYIRKVKKVCTVEANSVGEAMMSFHQGERENIEEIDLIDEDVLELEEN